MTFLDHDGALRTERDRIIRGHVIVAWLKPERGGDGFNVVTPDGVMVGVATTKGEAVVMMDRFLENADV